MFCIIKYNGCVFNGCFKPTGVVAVLNRLYRYNGFVLILRCNGFFFKSAGVAVF